MDKYILISAPGKTDPIRGCADGPILHIARHYKPDQVVLLLTEEIGRDEEKHHHNEEAVRLLGEKIGKEFQIDVLHTNIRNPHSYDELLSITDICHEYKLRFPDYKILLNITSGTPQLETALCMIALSDSERYIPVQVSTPLKKSNTNEHFEPGKDSIEDWFETNFDNEDSENRCSEPLLMNYKRPLIQFQINSLIQNYDYAGAVQLYEANKNIFSEETGKLLMHAQKRLNLETEEAQKYAKELKLKKLLYYPARANAAKLVEYYLSLRIKQIRGELNDFAMRLEIMTLYLALYVLEEHMEIQCEDICVTSDERNDKRNDRKNDKRNDKRNDKGAEKRTSTFYTNQEKCCSKIPGISQYMDDNFFKKDGKNNKKFEWGRMLNAKIVVHIVRYLTTQEKYKQYRESADEMLRWASLSEKIRNPAAHTIISITEENFKQHYGKTTDDLCTAAKSTLIRILGSDIKKEMLDAYETINKAINASMNGELSKVYGNLM